MMIVKKEMPNPGEFVLIKISKIAPHGAYCKLIEYDLEAYLPIAEVSSGWIKNIHEFIKEGQQDVAKVIYLDKDKRTIDISLKKVSTKEKKDKITEYSLEKRAEGIFAQAASSQEERAEAAARAATQFSTYYDLIETVFSKKNSLEIFPNKEFARRLQEIVDKTIKPKKYTVSYDTTISTTDTKEGIKIIKKALGEVEESGVEVLYVGAPKYRLTATGPSYIDAESKIKGAEKIISRYRQVNFVVKTQVEVNGKDKNIL